MSRILRCVVCFLLICCILVNCSPLRADATAAGAAAAITGAATVSVSAPMVIGATLIALGLYVGVNGTDGIEAVAQSAVSHLESAGTYIKDGCVELLQTVNSAGEKAYYVAGEMMDNLRSWVYDSDVVNDFSGACSTSIVVDGVTFSSQEPFYVFSFSNKASGYAKSYYSVILSSRGNTIYKYDSSGTQIGYSSCNDLVDGTNCYYSVSASTSVISHNYMGHYTSSSYKTPLISLAKQLNLSFFSDYDLTLGYLPSQTTDLTDGTSARAWSKAMTNNGLYVTGGSNDPEPPDENNGKWFWPLAFTVVAADLWAMSQVDEWSGKTPKEFDDYRTQTEFEILSRPEVEFGQGIEIAPVTSPSPDPGTGTNPDPGTNPDQDGSEEVKTDYTTWFSRLYTSVENIAGKFDEIPNKFQSWISDLKTDIQAQTDKLAEHASNTLAAIQSLPESFAESLADLKSAVLSVPNSIKEFFNPKPAVDTKPSKFFLDLRDFFPFCIPFDIAAFFGALVAVPQAPVFNWELQDLSGNKYEIEVDLSPWDPHAQLFRDVQIVLFIIGLALLTKNLIKW